MNAEACLLVCSGVHAGARSELLRGQRVLLGSSDACGIRLLDEAVAARHVELEPRARRLRLHALAPGVRVRNRELRQGRRATLRGGDEIHVAAVALRYEDVAAARWRLPRWPWDNPLRAGRSRIAILLGTAALGSAALAAWPRDTRIDSDSAREGADPSKSGVTRQIDARSGRAVYSGIVHDERELGLLRARVQRPGEPAALFRVAVRTRVLRALHDVLARHYAVSQVTELQPGHYRVVTGGGASHLDDIAWDTTTVAREAREAVRGIEALEFAENPALLSHQAPLPLSTPHWTLVSTPHGHWITDGTPRRYFEGGQLAGGQIVDLARCSVRLVDRSRKRILHYSAEAGNGSCH